MEQVNIRASPGLLKKFREKVGEKRGAQQRALEEALKLWMKYKGGVFVALLDGKLKTLKEIREVMKKGDFAITPLNGAWSEEERAVLNKVAAEFLEKNPPEKLSVGRPSPEREIPWGAGIERVKNAGRDELVYALWGDKPDERFPFLRRPDRMLTYTPYELALETERKD